MAFGDNFSGLEDANKLLPAVGAEDSGGFGASLWNPFNWGGGQMGDWLKTGSGTTMIGEEGPTFGQSLFGGITPGGDATSGALGKLAGFGGGLLKAGLAWGNYKRAGEALDFQKNAYSEQLADARQTYNQQQKGIEFTQKSMNPSNYYKRETLG